MKKILFIASGFAPYQFSENIVNTKLVLAFLKKGYKVDVISKNDEGKCYVIDWLDKWSPLKKITHEVQHEQRNFLVRLFDLFRCFIRLKILTSGIRWGVRALNKAFELHSYHKYDYVLSRSPNDISHVVAYYFARKTKVKWIANWNDPISHIWPKPYDSNISIWNKLIFDYFFKKIIEKASYNTFPSKELEEHILAKLNIKNKKMFNTFTIPHIGFNHESFQRKKNKKFRLCHIGNLSIERDPNNLLKALSNLIMVRKLEIAFDLIGNIDASFDTLFEQACLSGIVEKKIKNLSYDQSLIKMTEYDVLVVIEANMEESIFLPSKVADYASLEIPILAITPQKSCLSTLLNTCGGGLAVNCDSWKSIEKAISSMHKDWLKDEINEKYNSRRLKKYFSPENIISIYEQIFQKAQ